MRKFQSEDFQVFKEWHEKRGLSVPSEAALPRLGLIEDDLAAGFLIQTDCRLGFLDFYVTNPDAPKKDRAKAIEEISAKLIEAAHRLGIKVLMCNTGFSSLKKLAEKYRFTYLGEYSSYSRGI